MDSSLGGGYERTVTKSQPYRGLGLVTWADRAANDNLDVQKLPTPLTGDAKSSRNSTANRSEPEKAHAGNTLTDIFVPNSKLPTPKALDGIKGNLKTSQERKDAGHYVDLPNVANDLAGATNWGQYEAAVLRWEQVIGREAPSPTNPDGRDGSHRLSARFTEWMMGLDEGWVTSPEIGLTRNEALKACGNGVVPQQAALALNILLDGVDW